MIELQSKDERRNIMADDDFRTDRTDDAAMTGDEDVRSDDTREREEEDLGME